MVASIALLHGALKSGITQGTVFVAKPVQRSPKR